MKEYKCYGCDKTIVCKVPQNFSNHLQRCNAFKEYKNGILTEEFLIREYIECGKSAKQISDEINIGVNPIIKKLRDFGIETRSIRESKAMPLYKSRIEATNLERYGAVNPLSKGTTAYEKRNDTVMKKYGVTTVFKHPDVIAKIRKATRQNIEDNGDWRIGRIYSDSHREAIRLGTIRYIESCKGQISPRYNNKSIPILEAIAENMGINDLQHAENGGEFKVAGYFVDGYSPSHNIVFEYDEEHHFDKHGNLSDRDKYRQNIIENALGCTFIRITDEDT